MLEEWSDYQTPLLMLAGWLAVAFPPGSRGGSGAAGLRARHRVGGESSSQERLQGGAEVAGQLSHGVLDDGRCNARIAVPLERLVPCEETEGWRTVMADAAGRPRSAVVCCLPQRQWTVGSSGAGREYRIAMRCCCLCCAVLCCACEQVQQCLRWFPRQDAPTLAGAVCCVTISSAILRASPLSGPAQELLPLTCCQLKTAHSPRLQPSIFPGSPAAA